MMSKLRDSLNKMFMILIRDENKDDIVKQSREYKIQKESASS